MRHSIFTLTFILCAITATAQPKNNRCSFPWGIHLHDKDNTVVDTTQLIVEYALCADDLTDEKTFIDWEILEVGARMSKYYSYFVWRSDSIIHEWHKRNPHAHNTPTWRGGGGKHDGTWTEFEWGEIFIQDGQLSEYCHMPNALTQYNAYYTEERPQFGWQLADDTLSILGYRCQKAVCHWRGRDYEAWFTPQIPTRHGPWKFGGLPGLIMKLQDADSLYRWDAIALSARQRPITKNAYKDYKKSTRRSVQEYQRKANENYTKMAGIRSVAGWTPKGEPIIGDVIDCYKKYEQLEKE